MRIEPHTFWISSSTSLDILLEFYFMITINYFFEDEKDWALYFLRDGKVLLCVCVMLFLVIEIKLRSKNKLLR